MLCSWDGSPRSTNTSYSHTIASPDGLDESSRLSSRVSQRFHASASVWCLPRNTLARTCRRLCCLDSRFLGPVIPSELLPHQPPSPASPLALAFFYFKSESRPPSRLEVRATLPNPRGIPVNEFSIEILHTEEPLAPAFSSQLPSCGRTPTAPIPTHSTIPTRPSSCPETPKHSFVYLGYACG